MSQSLGLLEVKGLVGAITAADTMAKAANITVLGIERAKGFAWFTVKVTGQVGAVQSAIEAGSTEMKSLGLFITAKVIPRASNIIFDIFQDNEGKTVEDTESERQEAPQEELERVDVEETSMEITEHAVMVDSQEEVATQVVEAVEATDAQENPLTEVADTTEQVTEESVISDTTHELAHRQEGTVTIVATPDTEIVASTASLDEDLAQVEETTPSLESIEAEEKPKKTKRSRKSKK